MGFRLIGIENRLNLRSIESDPIDLQLNTIMKKSIKSLIAIGSCIQSLNVAALPSEFMNCGDTNLSFGDLKYYEKQELIDGYCFCSYVNAHNRELHTLVLQRQLHLLRAYGVSSDKYRESKRESEAEGNAYKVESDTAGNNASRILRILQKDHKYKDRPKCKDGRVQ
jgi:hypothetical protein